jgi:hypothetical protein
MVSYIGSQEQKIAEQSRIKKKGKLFPEVAMIKNRKK